MTMTAATWPPRAQYGGVNGDQTETDPAPKPKKRSFTARYKLDILIEYESLTDPGAKGSLLRREGLYSSLIVEWRKARDSGTLSTGTAANPKNSSDQRELERLRKGVRPINPRV